MANFQILKILVLNILMDIVHSDLPSAERADGGENEDGVVLIAEGTHSIEKRQFKGSPVAVGGRSIDARPLEDLSPNPYKQCFVNVGVYTSESLETGLQDAEVTIVSRETYNETHWAYLGYSRGMTNANGQVCLAMFCMSEGVIYVSTEDERLFAQVELLKKNLPPRFRVFTQSGGEEVLFYGFVFGNIKGKTGPVYTYKEKSFCEANGTNDYHFVFSYLSFPDDLVETPVPTISAAAIPDNRSWYYGLTQIDRQTCYLKVKMKVASSQVKLELRSLDPDTRESYGLFISGPKHDPDSNDKTLKAACLQFRCPVIMVNVNVSMNTLVEGKFIVPGKPNGCIVRSKHLTGIKADENGFSAVLYTGKNNGPREGIFKHSNSMIARSRCLAGRDFLSDAYTMAFDDNNAVEYDCS